MRHLRERTEARRGRPAFCAGLVALAAVVLGLPTGAAAEQSVVVTEQVDFKQPRVLDGRIYGIDTHGSDVVVGGTFTKIRNGAYGTPEIPQPYVFRFSSATGQIVESFRPALNGEVEAVAFSDDGQSVYVAGSFTTVNGESRDRVVRLRANGSIDPTFNASVNDTVKDMALVGDRLILAGRFNRMNGQPAPHLAAVDAASGTTDRFFNLPATVSRYEFAPYVQEIDASADGRWLVVAGNFERIGAASRHQLAVVDLDGTPSVANWSTSRYSGDCAPVYNDSYIRGIDISPDSSYFVVNTTGAWRGTSTMCDTSARWELPPVATGAGQEPTWTDHTGGDTLWAVEVTESAVYVGGHQRWHNNAAPTPSGDNDGPGAVSRPGIAALDPSSGVPLSWNPGRDRGRGVEAFAATDDHLFIGSDTVYFNDELRQRLAVLPTAGGTAVPVPKEVELPVDLYFTNGSTLRRVPFNGTTLGTAAVASSPTTDGVSWTGTRDGFVQDGRLHYFGGSQAMWRRPFTTSSIGAATNLSSSVGYVDSTHAVTPFDQPLGVAETRAAAFHMGRIYYVKTTDSKLYWRGYSLESGIVGAMENVAASQDFSQARSLEFVGDWLYATWADNKLYRIYAPGGDIVWSTRTLVDDGNVSGLPWSTTTGLWALQRAGPAVPPPAPTFQCGGQTPWRASYVPNNTLSGAATTVRCEATIDNDWGVGSPAGSGVGPDNFSVRWERTLTLAEARSLKVTTVSDDGVRVSVDGDRIIDAWRNQSATTSTGTTTTLAPGDHRVVVEYYEATGSAVMKAQLELVAPTQPTEPDNVAPETTVTSPAVRETVSGTSVTAVGTATDNRSVQQVRVAIHDRDAATNKWLQTDGTWGPNYAFRLATLDAPGDASTGWSYNVGLPPGNYALDVKAVDATGNQDATSVWRPFTVSTGNVDTTPPDGTVTSPGQHETLTRSNVVTSGTAVDDTGVQSVRVAVHDRDAATNKWLQADGTWGPTYAFRTAVLAAPGAPTTSWQLGLTLGSGRYALDVKVVDTAGNVDPTSVWRPFVVQGG